MTNRLTIEQLSEILDNEGYADLGAESLRPNQFEGEILAPSECEVVPSKDEDLTKINPCR